MPLYGGDRRITPEEAAKQAPYAVRPTLYGSRHAVSAGHYLATAAGFSILEAGGNAIDAGCAAGIALGILHPDEVNFAGVAPIMIRLASGECLSIAGLGHWPMSIPPNIFNEKYNGEMPIGVLRTVVPAAPDAWITALRDHGTMSFADVAGPAMRYANEGFSAYWQLVENIKRDEDGFRRWESNAKIFLPNGRPPELNSRFKQLDLASTIKYMIDEEKAASTAGRVAGLEAARAAFYAGDIAHAIVNFIQQEGGYLSLDDMANFKSKYEPIVSVRWRDFNVMTCGPWCQGPALAHALKLVEKIGLGDLKHNDDKYIHVLTEVIKSVFSDREYRYGDPRFVDVDMEKILSDEYLELRSREISMDRAMPDMPPLPGMPKAEIPKSDKIPERPRDTSYCCVVDRWGNAFSATPSDVSYTSPVVPGTGVVPSFRGAQSRPDPRHPSGFAPGKRPRLTPNPAIAVKDDGSIMPFGCPGGDGQVQAMLQVFLNINHFGMDVQQAIDSPRFISYSFPNSFAPYEHYPARMGVESRIDGEVIESLRQKGHDVLLRESFTRSMCSVNAIYYDASTKFFRAGADPRQACYAIVS